MDRPTQTPPMASTTLANTLATASIDPCLNKLSVSLPNAENVVKPPRSPMMRKALVSAVRNGRVSSSSETPPMVTHPRTLTASVPTGNDTPSRRLQQPDQQIPGHRPEKAAHADEEHLCHV